MKDLLENKMFKVFIGAIILVILIIIIVGVIVSGKGKTISAENLTTAAKAYYEKNPALLPRDNYDSTTVPLSTLISMGYISGDKEGSTCPSYVMVTNMNGTYEYTPFIKCNESTTNNSTSLMSKLTANMTKTGSGFYNVDGKFIFRGENPNNYVSFGNTLWRILGLDENNNIKMIYSDIYVDYYEWDNRYNKDVENDKGINDYITNERSRIKEYLDSFFTGNTNGKTFTANQISRTVKFKTCTGKADLSSGNINICDETTTDRVSTLTVLDYINASLDESCSVSDTMNCRNYNFLNTSGWTITAYNGNSYQSYFIDKNKGIYPADTYIRAAVRPVIALKNDVVYAKGSGTYTDPYMIG